MKVIGITGNVGKTTTCEMLYQYLLTKGRTVGLISSNGIFMNNETILKNTFGMKLYNKYYFMFMKSHLDYIVVEINEETSASKNTYAILNKIFNCLCNVTYEKELCDSHTEKENFYFSTFEDINSKKYLCNINDKNLLEEKTSRNFITYSTINDYSLGFNNTIFTYDDVEYSANFISSFDIIDLSACLGILKEIDEFDPITLQNMLNTLIVRGHMDKYIKNSKNIILDTGWDGIDLALARLQEDNIIDLSNVSIILVPYPEDINISIYKKQWRERAGNFFRTNDLKVFLTGYTKAEELFENYNYDNYEYYQEIEDALNAALNSDKDFIYIMGNYKFRVFRELLTRTNNE